MKEDIHPETNKVTVKCACGNTFETISTKEDLRVDVCSECHPFFSGGERFLDSEGRISKFERKYGISSSGSEPDQEDAVDEENTVPEELEEATNEEG